MKYLKLVQTDAEIVASKENDILYYSEESSKINFIKQKVSSPKVILTKTDGTKQTDTFSDGIIPASQYKENADIQSVEMGDVITQIGGEAFASCSSLENITFSTALTTIGMASFAQCTALTTITLPSSITSIGMYAFMDASSLASVVYQGTTYTTVASLSAALRENGASLGTGSFDGTPMR